MSKVLLRRAIERALPLTLAFTLAACADVKTTAVLDDVPVWPVAPELRIGSVDDPDFSFGSVHAIEVGQDGSIYSLHGPEEPIRRWTPDGRPGGTIGRVGDGPGEFRSPHAMAWQRDSLWVLDGQEYRISYFAADGTFLRRLDPRVDLGTREQYEKGLFPARPDGLLADGTILGVTPSMSRAVVDGSLSRVAYVRMGEDGVTLDTLTVLPVGKESVLGVLHNGVGTYAMQPFGDGVVAARIRDGSGLLILERYSPADAGPGEFRLTRLDVSGDTVFSDTHSYEAVRIPPEQVDSAVEARAEFLHGFIGARTGTAPAQWRGWVQEAIYAPDFHTPVSALVPGRDGTIWLALNPPADDGRIWLVLSGEGEPIGNVLLPEDTRVLIADQRNVWGVERDELDVDHIVRYAVGGP